MPDLLPSSLARETRGTIRDAKTGLDCVPMFCANCGKLEGYIGSVDAEGMKAWGAFWLCEPCAERWSDLAGFTMAPDEVFFAKLHAAQEEAYGRQLTEGELLQQLDDPNSMISKLARDRKAG